MVVFNYLIFFQSNWLCQVDNFLCHLDLHVALFGQISISKIGPLLILTAKST
jgi:hypothetical protein